MRNITLWLLAALLLVVMTGVVSASPQLAPGDATLASLVEPTDRVFDAGWKLVPPIVDGDLSEWESFERYTLDDQTAEQPDPSIRPTPEDLSAWASVVWDSDYMYVAVSVIDDVVYRQSRDWRLDDLAAFSFDLDQDGTIGLYDVWVTVSPDGMITRNDGFRLGVDGVAVVTDQGWQAEFSIPLHEFGEEFLTDAVVGFSWGLRDNDGDGPLKWLSWAGYNFMMPAPGQGVLQFVDGPVRQWIAVRSGDANYMMYDSVLNSWYPDDNYGEAVELGIRAGHGPWHIVMKMDMPDLPPNARIIRARLHTNVSYHNSEASFMVRMYKLLRPWEEGSVSWTNTDSATRWDRPGADQVDVDRAGIYIDENQFIEIGEYEWEFGSLVTEWYANPESNHGVLLRAEEGVSVEYRVSSSECGSTCAPWFDILVELPPPDSETAADPSISLQ